MVQRLGIWALLLVMPQTSSGGADSLKKMKKWFGLRKPAADACGCSRLLQRGGNDPLRLPSWQQSTWSKTSSR